MDKTFARLETLVTTEPIKKPSTSKGELGKPFGQSKETLATFFFTMRVTSPRRTVSTSGNSGTN